MARARIASCPLAPKKDSYALQSWGQPVLVNFEHRLTPDVFHYSHPTGEAFVKARKNARYQLAVHLTARHGGAIQVDRYALDPTILSPKYLIQILPLRRILSEEFERRHIEHERKPRHQLSLLQYAEEW